MTITLGVPVSTILFVSCLALTGCAADEVAGYDVNCEDDRIGWVHQLVGLVELPPAEFEVECASGWGHGVATRASSAIVQLPAVADEYLPHPDGGLLLWYTTVEEESLWRDRLGVEVASQSLLWVDEQVETVRWIRDDLHYNYPVVVSGETGTELWVWGSDETQDYLSRLDLSNGDVLERVVWPDGRPDSAKAAWPEVGGLWLVTREIHEEYEFFRLQQMSSFGNLGPVLRTHSEPLDRPYGWSSYELDPTPGGGILWYDGLLESIAADGSMRWVLDEPHSDCVVDEHGGFLLGGVAAPHELEHHAALTLQRRRLEDASLLWTREHHRYEFAHGPKGDQWLYDYDSARSAAARREGGYLLAQKHAYPASTCLWQPILWAIDINGDVEWAHRDEVCGGFVLLDDRVGKRVAVHGFSYPNADGSIGNLRSEWLEYFDL